MTHETPVGDCGRIGLLLSHAADDAATPSQRAEIDAHLPTCDACRRAAAVDAAVRARFVERTSAPAPSWLEGFAARTAEKALVLRREARTQNRLLWMSAAAAALVAVTMQFAWPPSSAATSDEAASVREIARSAVWRAPRFLRHEGR